MSSITVSAKRISRVRYDMEFPNGYFDRVRFGSEAASQQRISQMAAYGQKLTLLGSKRHRITESCAVFLRF
jgi:hypothetical protein